MTDTQVLQQLTPVLRLLPFPVWAADESGRLLVTSDSFRAICGELTSLHQLVPKQPELVTVLVSPVETGTVHQVTVELHCGSHQGSEVSIAAVASELNGAVVTIGWLQLAGNEAEDSEWLINQIAHALRNPIFAASVQSEAIKMRAKEAPELARTVDLLHRQLKRLEESIEEMLLLGRPARINPEEVEVPQLLTTIADSYREGHRVDPATIDLVISGRKLPARWDARAVRIVLERLLDNAVQQTDEPHLIELHADLGDDEVRLTVRDHGKGIPDEIRDRIFLPFFPQHRGRPGLGLSIALKYLHAVGGRIELDSDPDQGTEVRCFLPRFFADQER